MDIRTVIAGLLSSDESQCLLRQELIIRLSMWMQNSSDVESYRFGTFSGILGYLLGLNGETAVQDWPAASKDMLIRNLPMGVLKGAFITYDFQSPLFAGFLKEYSYGLDGLDAISEAANILLWYKPPSKSNRFKASLAKIHFALSTQRLVRHRYFEQLPTFRRLWRRHYPAASLIYVNAFELADQLMLDPNHNAFVAHVDDLANDQDRIRQALAQAKAVDGLLRERLRGHADCHLQLSIFPKNLEAHTPPPREVRSAIRKRLLLAGERDDRYKYELWQDDTSR